MKVLALITYTDCENKWRSLASVGHEVDVLQYDALPHERHGELVAQARLLNPNMIVMVGAVEEFHGRPVLRSDILRQMRGIAPTILMCNDAADPPWWPTLKEYKDNEAFDLYVSIDGSFENPIATYRNGMLKLTPTDWRPFLPQPWERRDIKLGMVGGMGHRQGDIEQLINSGEMVFHQGPVGRTYDEMAAIMCRTKVTFSCGRTGSGAALHVKGRVVESGLAGGTVMELYGSPAAKWFTPGVDYLEYAGAADAIQTMRDANDEQLREMASRFHDKVVNQHHPSVFWHDVLERLEL